MASETVLTTNSLAKQSRVIISNHAGADLKVASVTTTTVVVDDITPLTGTTLYAAANPGQLVILSSAASSANNGDVANITGISGSTLTVDVDFATGGELADGDLVAVLPPLAFELFPNGGHTLNTTNNNDETMGLTETFRTHNTPMDVRIAGDIPVFQTADSDGFARLLMAGVGGYKQSSGHIYRPIEADDGTYSPSDELTVYTKDGNNIVGQAFYGLFSTQLALSYPQNDVATASLSLIGSGVAREIGGTGKEFTTGAANWIVDDLDCDTGPRFTFREVYLELGGSFGDGLTDAAEKTVQDLTVTIDRGAMEDSVLGTPFIAKPEELEHRITITGTRILSNDTLHEYDFGASTDVTPGTKTEDRVLVFVNKGNQSLKIDVPRAIVSSEIINRQRGRFTESFTIEGLATLDANGCIDTATPLYQIDFDNDSTDDLWLVLP